MTTAQQIPIFVRCIWQWYAQHKRSLPWRDLAISSDSERAYHVLVSEIMLQQTQVSRVKIVFKNFLETYPTLESLAKASNGEVVLTWRGMGYNNRALRLRDSAKEVVTSYNGVFPTDMTQLQSLPGVGHYTAAAIRNFAFNIPTACLDTNIRRILHRSFYGPEKSDGTWQKNDKHLLVLADKLLAEALKEGDARNWHAALMDYGSLVCTRRSPKWDICPLTKAGAMKAAYKTPDVIIKKKKEPGRLVGSTFVPNRIFRGKVVEELRDEPDGLVLEEVGQRICIDWNQAEHLPWLASIVDALKKDQLVQSQNGKVMLRS